MSASGTVALFPDAAAGATGQLAGRLGGAVDDRRDLVERDREDVVQHERQPLGGLQRLEHDQEGEADRVGQERLVLRVRPVRAVDDRLRYPQVGHLPPRVAGAEHVQGHPGDDGREPAAEVLDFVGVGSAKAQPGLLDGVVRLAHRAEHPVGHSPQVGAVGLEPVGQVIALVHLRSRSSVGHGTSPLAAASREAPWTEPSGGRFAIAAKAITGRANGLSRRSSTPRSGSPGGRGRTSASRRPPRPRRCRNPVGARASGIHLQPPSHAAAGRNCIVTSMTRLAPPM
jgi:hypothetical protein